VLARQPLQLSGTVLGVLLSPPRQLGFSLQTSFFNALLLLSAESGLLFFLQAALLLELLLGLLGGLGFLLGTLQAAT
jgi:hypothetical protein